MNAFVKLVCWQIAFILFAVFASVVLNTFLDKPIYTFVLFIASFVMTFASWMVYFLKSLTFSTTIAAAAVSFSAVSTAYDSSATPLTIMPAILSLFILLAAVSLAEYLEDWNYRWLLGSLVIEYVCIYKAISLEISIVWFSWIVGSVVLLALLALLGKSRAIRSTSTSPA